MGGVLASLDDFKRDGAAPLRRVAFAHDAAPAPPGGLQVPFARLEIVLDGVYRNALCDAAGQAATVALGPGEALFVAPQCWNRPAWDADVRLLSLLFGTKHLGLSLQAWDAETRAFGPVEKRGCAVPGNSPLYQIVEALSGLRREPEAAACALPLAEAAVAYARGLVARSAAEEERRSAALHRKVRQYVERNLDAGATRERVARQFGVSPNYLSRVFRDQGGTTFSDFLAACRIGTARRMLETDAPLAEIAARCGFRDVNYFLKVFKKRMGRTPTEYRLSVRARPEA